jgi:hypothetical protein
MRKVCCIIVDLLAELAENGVDLDDELEQSAIELCSKFAYQDGLVYKVEVTWLHEISSEVKNRVVKIVNSPDDMLHWMGFADSLLAVEKAMESNANGGWATLKSGMDLDNACKLCSILGELGISSRKIMTNKEQQT